MSIFYFMEKLKLPGQSILTGQQILQLQNMFITKIYIQIQSFITLQDNTLFDYLKQVTMNGTFFSSTPNFNLNVTLFSTSSNSQGWVNYIEVNARRFLNCSGSGNQFLFRDKRSVTAGM